MKTVLAGTDIFIVWWLSFGALFREPSVLRCDYASFRIANFTVFESVIADFTVGDMDFDGSTVLQLFLRF